MCTSLASQAFENCVLEADSDQAMPTIICFARHSPESVSRRGKASDRSRWATTSMASPSYPLR